MNLLPDIVLAALLILGYIIGRKKGLLKSVWKIAALVLSIVLVIVLKNPAVELVSGTKAAENINTAIANKIHLPPGGGVNITESLHLPDVMQSEIDIGIENAQSTAGAISDAAALSLTNIVITIAVCVALFVIIRLLLMAAYMILNGISKAPIIKGANKLAGGLLGMVNMIFIVFLVLTLFTMLAPADSGLYEMIEHSYLVKYLYNNNILLQLFMR